MNIVLKLTLFSLIIFSINSSFASLVKEIIKDPRTFIEEDCVNINSKEVCVELYEMNKIVPETNIFKSMYNVARYGRTVYQRNGLAVAQSDDYNKALEYSCLLQDVLGIIYPVQLIYSHDKYFIIVDKLFIDSESTTNQLTSVKTSAVNKLINNPNAKIEADKLLKLIKSMHNSTIVDLLNTK